MTRRVVVEIGDRVRCEARTRAQALAAALKQAAAMLSGNYAARVLELRGAFWLLWREPHGWCYREAPASRFDVAASRFVSEESAERAARRSAAVYAWGSSENDDRMPDVVTDERDRATVAEWAGVQRALYHAAEELKLSGDAAHAYACAHGAELERKPNADDSAERAA